MRVLGIDPGPEMSAAVVFNGEKVLSAHYINNATVRIGIEFHGNGGKFDKLAIEFPEARGGGVPVPQSLLDTAAWAGRFDSDEAAMLLYPRTIRIHFCDTAKATRAQVRQAIIDRIGPVGAKGNQGPLYQIGGVGVHKGEADDGESITSHLWDALAVAITAWDKIQEGKE